MFKKSKFVILSIFMSLFWFTANAAESSTIVTEHQEVEKSNNVSTLEEPQTTATTVQEETDTKPANMERASANKEKLNLPVNKVNNKK